MLLENSNGEGEGKKCVCVCGGGGGEEGTLTSSGKDWAEFYECIK